MCLHPTSRTRRSSFSDTAVVGMLRREEEAKKNHRLTETKKIWLGTEKKEEEQDVCVCREIAPVEKSFPPGLVSSDSPHPYPFFLHTCFYRTRRYRYPLHHRPLN